MGLRFWGRFGAALGSLWGCFEAEFWGHFRDHFGAFWDLLRVRFGVVLELSFRAILGPIWGSFWGPHLGAILGVVSELSFGVTLGPILGHFGPILGALGAPFWGRFGLHRLESTFRGSFPPLWDHVGGVLLGSSLWGPFAPPHHPSQVPILGHFLAVLGPVEAAPEYRVIVDANNLTVEIENELSEWGGPPFSMGSPLFYGALGSPPSFLKAFGVHLPISGGLWGPLLYFYAVSGFPPCFYKGFGVPSRF